MEGCITEFDSDLNGILIDEHGIRVAIPGALIGEKIRYHLEHKSPHEPKAWGRCDALLAPSPARVKSPCPYAWPCAGACAGCPLMHMSAQLQAKLKTDLVLNALKKAGILYIQKLRFHTSDETLRYRNRTDLVVTEIRGKLVLGSYKPRSHDVLPFKQCLILRLPLNDIITCIAKTANAQQIPAYKNVNQPHGALRYVSLFANDDGHVLVDLVCKSAQGQAPAWLDGFAKSLIAFSPIKGISFSLNDSPNNAIRTAPSQTLCGATRLPEHHGSTVSRFAASGFTQLNSQIAAKIYTSAKDWLPATPKIVWDLYCGAGAFGRIMAPSQSLYGAEFSPSAIQAAQEATQGDPFQTHFEVLDLEKAWPQWPRPNVILLDPPRKGLSPKVIQNLATSRVETLIYMSCNPETMAQNIAALPDYVIERIEAFDMMPHTKHVETLAL
ncbi:MAG: 23S rRNA (uracil(1939)-C(5))-methyltransferase RlmD, partial [Proteobacteria bacterium]|nr:23S rRNA (uracil(1939)-C(5))-methyltransferase RlmD [Pseudomonadota bacterium]